MGPQVSEDSGNYDLMSRMRLCSNKVVPEARSQAYSDVHANTYSIGNVGYEFQYDEAYNHCCQGN